MFTIAGFVILAQAFYAGAQTTAVCSVPQDNWMVNSLGQNPCRVAEFLSYPCHAFTVVSLNGSQYYTGAIDNPCECNTVMYSLLSACSICQGGSQQGWQTYSQNCSHTYIGQYPEDILSTTAIPHWAYIDISGSNVFDTNQAKATGDAPETTKGSLTTTSVVTTIVSVTQSATNGPQKSSRSIVGPVVGGIVGGLALVALVVGGVLFWTMRRRSSESLLSSGMNILGSPSTVPSSPGAINGGSLNQGLTASRIYEPYDTQLLQTSQANPNSVSMYVTPAAAYMPEPSTTIFRP